MKIFLTDDHAILVGGLVKIIEAEPDLEIVGSAGSVQETLDALTQQNVDLLITDYNLPDDDGLSLVKKKYRQSPKFSFSGSQLIKPRQSNGATTVNKNQVIS